ncbi:MAG: GNAT family N-acetyltransferase [Gammaproteobacteria bacterium]
MNSEYSIIHTSWQQHQAEIRNIRLKVFVEEQQVPIELEWEGNDDDYHYVLALDNKNQAIATGRIGADGHIGRMAVLKPWRHKGVGSTMLEALLEYAQQQNIDRIFLNSQSSAIPFYEKQGFQIISEEFMDAGIPHKTMEKCITKAHE